MKLNFRQGIVSYPQAGNVQQFLQLNAGVVDFSATNGPTSITFAHKDTDYFLSEGTDVAGAWGPFASTPVWLFWDIDRATGLRTFGHTEVQPVSGPTEPVNPVQDQHWFDTLSVTHFYRVGSNWIEAIRVFAAKFDGSTFGFLGTNTASPFAGTQVGLANQTSFSGAILFDESGNPVVKSSNGTFFTTETEFFNGSTRVNGIRLESDTVTGVLNQSTAAYAVVKFATNNRLELADYDDSNGESVAITTQQGIFNDLINVIAQGVITNELWNWPTIGSELFISVDGGLIDVDPHITNPGAFPDQKTPVARVIGPTQIIFMQGLGGPGEQGPAGDVSNLPNASSTVKGITFLNIDPDVPTAPIALGVNDPLVTGGPYTPSTHLTDVAAHTSANVSVIPTGNITSSDVQDAIEELDSLIQDVASGLDPKESCTISTTEDLAATYNPAGGTGGTGDFTGAPIITDGINTTAGNRILVKDQSDPLQNGIYVVLNAALGTWERAADQDGSPANEVSAGNYTFVEQGTVHANGGFVVSGEGIITLNSDPIIWVRFSGTGGVGGGSFVPITHLTDTNAHTAANITNIPAASALFGTPTTTADVLASDVQGAINELLDEKAQRTPAYTVFANLPAAGSNEGMVAWVTADDKLYVSDGSDWQPLAREDIVIPYDIMFFIGGPMVNVDAISGSFIVTRAITIPINATGSLAFANTAPVGNISYIIELVAAGGGSSSTIGSVNFLAGLGAGSFTFSSQVVLAVGEQLQIINPDPVDANIEDVSITIVGTAPIV